MERTKKLTIFDSKFKRQSLMYVTYEDRQNQEPQIIRVELAGDLLDITDKLTDKERRSIQRRLSATGR